MKSGKIDELVQKKDDEAKIDRVGAGGESLEKKRDLLAMEKRSFGAERRDPLEKLAPDAPTK